MYRLGICSLVCPKCLGKACTKNGEAKYLTTENPDKFKEQAQIFLHEPVEVENITLG